MKIFSTLLFVSLFMPCVLRGQAISMQTAGEHMSYFTSKDQELSKSYMSYMSEVAHGNRARKMEKRREDVIKSLREAIREAGRVRPFKGDASLRDAYRDYWTLMLSIFVEDYHKIVDMEEIAERSYDAMEAYLLTQEKAGEKADQANEKLRSSYKAFAAANNIQLVEGQESKLSKKIVKAGEVNKYMNQIFLISFKSSVQEVHMMEALNKNDVSGVEQYRNSMSRFAEEGLLKLDSIKPYNGDGSYMNATRKLLEFQKTEAEKMKSVVDFLLKSEELNKIKAAFEAKPAAKRTQDDVDNFNKAIAEFNTAVTEFNKVNNELNNARSRNHQNFETTRKRFMDQHVPRA